MDLATIIGLIIAFIAVVGLFGLAVWFIIIRDISHKQERLAQIEARNKERLALIEKGLDPNLANIEQEKASPNRPLLIGLIIVFAVIGRIVAYFAAFGHNTNDKTFIYALPAFFVGFAILLFHFYRRRTASKK